MFKKHNKLWNIFGLWISNTIKNPLYIKRDAFFIDI